MQADRLLGRISMSQLTTWLLAGILAVAIVSAATGSLEGGVAPLLATAVVAVIATFAGTWLGWLGARLVAGAPAPHGYSSAITGLILALVLAPVTGQALLGIAVAGLVAGVSKYLLAWRGRHVLNPAVVGLLVAGWTGAAQAWWWVGSAVLTPVVALLGAVVLWRTRRAIFALSYAVPAVALTTLGYALLGMDAGTALRTAVLSGPIIFLACFMLTEPLTTPPRRWQRIAIGAGVAVLAAVPLLASAAEVSAGSPGAATWASWISPELALAVGNVVAFGFGLRQGVTLTLSSRGTTPMGSGGVLDLRFTPSRPLRFRAGQYVEIDIPQTRIQPGAHSDTRGRRRVLSVASAPGAGPVRLITRLESAPGAEPSPAKAALADLAIGGSVGVTLVAGDFLLPRRPAALIGVGIGFTPFLAMLEAIASGAERAPAAGWDLVVVQAVRDVRDVLVPQLPAGPEVPGAGVRAALGEGAALPTGVALVLIVPQGCDTAALPPGWRVIEGDAVAAASLHEAVPDLAQRQVLVSGSPASVSAVRAAARDLGVQRVRTDTFLGY